jgi:predicted DNA binding CopG/RHH family protein
MANGKKKSGGADRVKRESRVLVVFTEDERKKVQDRADARGLPLATFLRTLALDAVDAASAK